VGRNTTGCEIRTWLAGSGDAPGTGLLEVKTETAHVVIEAEAGGVVETWSSPGTGSR
jgi:hypothetical protein